MPLPSLARRSLWPVLLLGLLLTPGIASASAANRAIDPESTETSEGTSDGGWGPIVGACLGSLIRASWKENRRFQQKIRAC